MLEAFVPRDRLMAMAQGTELPTRAVGAVLFADISDFTPLADRLVRELGARAGAEKLTVELNRCYDALIERIHDYRGSVVGFSGDGITCWFDGDDGSRAVTSALAMQEAMIQLSSAAEDYGLSLKVAVASGPTRRFRVGDPHVQYLDVLAGTTISRVARAEQVARPGEVVMTSEVAKRLDRRLHITAIRQSPDAERFTVVAGLHDPAPISRWPELPPGSCDESKLRSWVLPAVGNRLAPGARDFLAELRQAVPVFVRFRGLDYDTDDHAGDKLDTFVRWVQGIAAHYEGALLQVTLGEKGDYLYLALGGPLAHEDDTERALRMALLLQEPPRELAWTKPMQCGVSRGLMRTGAYGSRSCQTYGVQGDEVNLAARLMQAALPGEILGSIRARDAAPRMSWSVMRELVLKGKPQPIAAFRLLGERVERSPSKQGSFVGRVIESGVLFKALDLLTTERRSSAFVVEGEPGIGKSRLLIEVDAYAQRCGACVFRGIGSAIECSTPYHAVRTLFAQLLGLPEGPSIGPDDVTRLLDKLADEPSFVQMAPLLTAVLPFELPDTAHTAPLVGPYRAERTQLMLVQLLAKRAANVPLVVLLEDAHSLDPSSLRVIVSAIVHVRPFLFIATTRPVAEPIPEYAQLLQATNRVELAGLGLDDLLTVVQEQLGTVELQRSVVNHILTTARGNPFFAEEMTRSLRDRGLLGRDVDDFAHLELPETLEGVITSRIDLLSPAQQLTLKVSSVIGQSFTRQTLEAVHPVQTDREQLAVQLEVFGRLDLTVADGADSYVFKHAMTHEVTYQLMLGEQRRRLHHAIGEWYETTYAAHPAPFYIRLAHHFGRAAETADVETQALPKAIHYATRAGDDAAFKSANAEAVVHYQYALSLVERVRDPYARASQELALRLALYQPLSLWRGSSSDQVSDLLRQTRPLAEQLGAQTQLFDVLVRRHMSHFTRGELTQAEDVAKQLQSLAESLGPTNQLDALVAAGMVALCRGDCVYARDTLERAIILSDGIGPSTEMRPLPPGIVSRCLLSGCLTYMGFVDRGAQMAEDVRVAARNAHLPFVSVFVAHWLAPAYYLRGDDLLLQQLVDEVQESTNRGKFLVFIGINQVYRGLSRVIRESSVDAIDFMQQGFAMYSGTGSQIATPGLLLVLGRAYTHIGQPARALTMLDEALAVVRGTGVAIDAAEIHAQRGDCLVALGRDAEAEQAYGYALTIARQQQAKLVEQRAANRLCRLWAAQGKQVEAHSLLASLK